MKRSRCCYCGRSILLNPRVKKKRQYCNSGECQRARRCKWQKKRYVTDAYYRANQRDAQALWRKKNPGYYKKYRATHPSYTQRNRELQRSRNRRRRCKKSETPDSTLLIAKMDSLLSQPVVIPCRYGYRFSCDCKDELVIGVMPCYLSDYVVGGTDCKDSTRLRRVMFSSNL